jgi:hypothetical protein
VRGTAVHTLKNSCIHHVFISISCVLYNASIATAGLEDSGALERSSSGADNNGQILSLENDNGESPPPRVTPRTLHSSSSNRGATVRASRDRPIKGSANTNSYDTAADDIIDSDSGANSAPKFEGDHPLKGVPNIGDLPAPEPVSTHKLSS